jgi:hypothetical protein
MKPLYLFFLLLLFPGCHEVTEYQDNDQARLTFIRTSDFQIDRTMEGLPQGRTLVSVQDELVLLSSSGKLYRLDSEEMRVDTSYTIGGSSGTGYGDAAFANNGHLYVLGPGSQVIEVNLSNDTVEDQFSPGSSIGAVCASSVEDRLYFIDTVEEYIGEIYTSNNHTGFTSNTYVPLADIMMEQTGTRKIVAVGSDAGGSIFGVWLDISDAARLLTVSAGAPCSKVEPLNQDSVYVICCPEWNSSRGFIHFVQGYVEPTFDMKIFVEGHPIDVCFNRNAGYSGYLSVLSRTDSGNTIVTVFEFPYSYTDPEMLAVISMDGFPRDIISPMDGRELIVLTSD